MSLIATFFGEHWIILKKNTTNKQIIIKCFIMAFVCLTHSNLIIKRLKNACL